MPLEPIGQLTERAASGGYAVGYFESWNLESLQGVISAAEETRSPVIVGFNGEFLTRPGRLAAERISWYGALGRAAAESASVPCGLIFNECSRDDSIRLALRSGFNLVMIADPAAAYDDYVRRARTLARYAHECNAAVEAEVGNLPRGSSGKVTDNGSLTDPELAARFVETTGVDMLAVSVGNVHVMVEGERGLDLKRLAAIRHRVAVPLDLHGGTGIAPEALREAIRIGVVKVSYGTYLKQRYLAAVRAALKNDQIDPHRLFGYGGQEDVMVAGRNAVREAVLERIELLGCCGMA